MQDSVLAGPRGSYALGASYLVMLTPCDVISVFTGPCGKIGRRQNVPSKGSKGQDYCRNECRAPTFYDHSHSAVRCIDALLRCSEINFSASRLVTPK